MRIIALDVGERRIGVAASDPLGKTAQPLETIDRDDTSLERIRELVEELEAERIVVGLPLLLDGSEGAQSERSREFAAEVERSTGVPVSLVDERLTTRQAGAVVRQGRVARGDRKAVTDRVAAALILSTYLEGSTEE